MSYEQGEMVGRRSSSRERGSGTRGWGWAATGPGGVRNWEGVLLHHLVKPIEEGRSTESERRQSEVEEFYHHGDIEAGVGLELGDWKNR